MLHSNLRLMPMISAENEWKYLVNETFIGEKCIIPLLNQVLDSHLVASSKLKSEIERQVAEEINHVRLYYKHVGADKLEGSRYDKDLSKVISELDGVTLKLFALQGMLEGVALGALDYRLLHWENSYSLDSDLQVEREEMGHTTLSYPFFKDLIRLEGQIDEAQFKDTSKKVNQVFTKCFSGQTLKDFVEETKGPTEWSSADFERTPAIHEFRKRSTKTIAKNRKDFLTQYFEAGKSV